MKDEPTQPVHCDRCGVTDNFKMTSLARSSWDNRNLAAKMKRAGWVTNGEEDWCADCAEDAAITAMLPKNPTGDAE